MPQMTPLLTLNAEQRSRKWIIDLIIENSPILEVIKVLDHHSFDQFQVGNHSRPGKKEEKPSEWVTRIFVFEVVVPKYLGYVTFIGPVLDVSEKWVGLIVRNTPPLPISMTSTGHKQNQRHYDHDQRQ